MTLSDKPLIGNTIGPAGWGTYRITREGYEPVANDPAAPLLAPGFVDVHIHGAFGVDFVTATREESIEAIEGLRAIGYEALLPTTVTASVEAVDRFRQQLPDHPLVAGFHLEGPFISDRYPGAQPKEAIVDPPSSPGAWDETLDDPRLRLVTLAPERPGGIDLIRRLTARGVRVSLGHTNATFAECTEAFGAGLRHATHTFNAMRPFHHREAGAIGFALAEDGLDTELIYDRVHVSRDAARVLFVAKPIDRVVAVSDATLAAGLPPGTRRNMWGMETVVDESSVRLLDGTLAGSAITLLDAFRNLLADFGPEVAIRATSLTPRRILGMTHVPRIWRSFSEDGEIVVEQ